jgi:RimJ/RimL family protein N-acetyltransferase
MIFPKEYKILKSNIFFENNFSIVPIRYEDRFDIMKWRNEQIYHLRQNEPLTVENQEHYFKNIISKLFTETKPNQLLFSFLRDNVCIGYGGLVHINWEDKNAEISFVMNTSLEDKYFIQFWESYLTLLKPVAFKELYLHKIYTYAFDLRPRLYVALINSGFVEESRLIDHSFVGNKYFDVLYHSCINPIHDLRFRKAKIDDIELIFNWANDPVVRKAALNSEIIKWETHQKWFERKIIDDNCIIYIFHNKLNTPIGQVRIENEKNEWFIDYSIDRSFRGIGLGKDLIKQTIDKHGGKSFRALVKLDNLPSLNVFQKLGFKEMSRSNSFINFILKT